MPMVAKFQTPEILWLTQKVSHSKALTFLMLLLPSSMHTSLVII